ncbi:hypothetical protein JD969_01980 [Planctomycetota bacterium]|nr:hypothetical protein JD969_01980 [Planctomycetota bacterium]
MCAINNLLPVQEVVLMAPVGLETKDISCLNDKVLCELKKLLLAESGAVGLEDEKQGRALVDLVRDWLRLTSKQRKQMKRFMQVIVDEDD